MALSAYERSILNAVPETHKQPLVVKFATSAARQLRGLARQQAPAIIAQQMIELLDFSNQCPKGHLVSVTEGDTNGTLLVMCNMADQPFIVDTLRMHLKTFGCSTLNGFNVILPIRRNDLNEITEIGSPKDQLESCVRFEVQWQNQAQPKSAEELERSLSRVLQLATSIVQDFSEMTRVVRRVRELCSENARNAPDKSVTYRETANLLSWLLQDNFVFMGLSIGQQHYGLLRQGQKTLWEASSLREWQPDENNDTLVDVRKGTQESPIHRNGLVDEILIQVPNERGMVTEQLRIQGLFTYRAVTQSSRTVPVLNQTLAHILRADGCSRGSYRYKGICNAFDSLPTEFLFTTNPERISEVIDQVLEATHEEDTRVDIVQSKRSDTTFVLMAMPRGNWSDDFLPAIKSALQQGTGATYFDQGAFVGRYDTMLIHVFLTGTKALSSIDIEALKEQLNNISKPWRIRLKESLQGRYPDQDTSQIFQDYKNAFETTYTERRPMSEVLDDIEMINSVRGESDPKVSLLTRADIGRVYLRVYQPENIALSKMLPVIDTFGLHSQNQFADPVQLPDGSMLWMDTFRFEPSERFSLEEISETAPLITDAIEAIFANKVTSDSLNMLLLWAKIPWKAIDLFRGLFGYARQLGLPYGLSKLQTILMSKPQLVNQLWNYFETKFNPDLVGDRETQLKAAAEEAGMGIRGLSNQEQDVVFRTFFNLIESTLRTNFYRRDKISHYISFKIDCAKVHSMPAPRMMFEIYVHHCEMEGIHLRGGRIARGGIRWSDRSDFRREVLDLVATQMVKNVLIVPEGAKGGFRMKHEILDRSLRRKRADELYEILIRGMLDVTDNLIEGKVVNPPDVVRYDKDDTYLVVAADKGTAHLSDTANKLSRRYGFWLDDAFASGGSNGYDHKKVGITARGGWMAALRHFDEIGLNPSTQSFTAVGIGDPAGDVFGNGVVYLSHKTKANNQMKLLGAFNHLHIFLDPEPNPEASYQERVRLFEEVQGWGGYNTELISEGGGIFSRSAKSIPLSKEVQKMLGVLTDELAPEVVIRLLLRMDVDLLWNGGIGTYVKSTDESDIDAGDPSNDHLRIDANELRARIVGEGGNLGFTQNGRVEFALSGGHINTDAIDNSGGVDMSDHEVNLKILLNPMVASGELSLEERNGLLEMMTEEVAEAVLANNNTHALQLSLDKTRSEADPLAFVSAINWVCNQGSTTRAFLRLPSDVEIETRKANGQGLTRPELAVLAAHVKMHIFKELLASEHTEIEQFNSYVHSYFPKEIQLRYLEQLGKHMLFRSIGMTMMLNEIVGYAGAWLFPTLKDITGASAIDICKAWLMALETINGKELLSELATISNPNARYVAWTKITEPLFSLLILRLFSDKEESQGEKEKIQAVLSRLPKLASTSQRERFNKTTAELTAQEIPVALAQRIAVLEELSATVEIAELLSSNSPSQSEMDKAIVSYFAIGEASCILPMIRALEFRRAVGGWDPAATAILRSRFFHLQATLTRSFELSREAKIGIDRILLRLTRKHLNSLNAEMTDMLEDSNDISALVVANARAQSWIRKHCTPGSPIQGTGF